MRNLNLRALIKNQPVDENELIYDSTHSQYLTNMLRLRVKKEVLTLKYCDETGIILHYQVLLPKQLIEEILHSLHSQSARHPGTTKVLQEHDKNIVTLH